MTLSELARVVRSKNAGPTLLTIDVLFADEDAFVRGRAGLTVEAVAGRYGRAVSDVSVFSVSAAKAVKIVLPRECLQARRVIGTSTALSNTCRF